jgi:tRNA 2-thiouridine synthesizing protein B
MAILHTVNRSTSAGDSLAGCVRTVVPGGGVLLMEDGVYAARALGKDARLLSAVDENIRFYALQADLQARGIAPEELLERVQIVDYNEFVVLTCEYDKVLAWF